ncbi:hypothetical protein DFH27DRAFT_544370 [Peziza echinospora]|nr:hypothetical protein DFH27DRAFT_544370 [Peziza echinospora]
MFQVKGFFQQFLGTPLTTGACGDSDADIYPTVRLPPVEVVDVEQLHDKRDRAMRHLVRLNHLEHAVLYGGYRGFKFHNHLPHHLGSAYLLGANEKQLHDIFDEEAKDMEPWTPSPSEVTEEDWRKYLGDHNYQRAFLDFFEDEVVRQGYEWKAVLMEFLLKGEKPLVNGLFCGLAHPLIHLGYAIEFNNREIAMEALTLTAASYTNIHSYIESDLPPPTPLSSKDPLVVLQRVRDDPRWDGVFDNPGQHNEHDIFPKSEALFLEFLNMLDVGNMDPNHLFHALVTTSTLLLTTTHKPENPQFDFFLLHTLTAAYAVRTLLPAMPAKHHLALLRGLWLSILYVYLTQMRPSVKPELIENVVIGGDGGDAGQGWDWLVKKAMQDELTRPDAHFVKGVRALRSFAGVYGGGEGKEDSAEGTFFLKAATKFVREYKGWVGFTYSRETLDIKA